MRLNTGYDQFSLNVVFKHRNYIALSKLIRSSSASLFLSNFLQKSHKGGIPQLTQYVPCSTAV